MPRILIVDDEPEMVRGLEDNLRFEGYQTLTAGNGADALAVAAREAPDLIVLDLMMPRVDGYGVLQHLNAKHPDKLACTIIASAVPETEILKRFNLPVFRIHPKPFDMTKLIADIRECTR